MISYKSVFKFDLRFRWSKVLATFLIINIIFGCATPYHGIGELQGPEETASDRYQLPYRPSTSPSNRSADAQPEFDWPVREGRMTRGFFLRKRRGHYGLDLAEYKGAPIYAAAEGYVVFAGRGFRGYGNLVVIEHNESWATLYAHLDKITVSEGQKVESGVEIGKMGRTGNARGVHLHFEIRQNRLPVNPIEFLPQGFGVGSQAHSGTKRM